MYILLEEDIFDNLVLFIVFIDINNWKGKIELYIFKLVLINIVYIVVSYKNLLLLINFYIMY